MDSFLWKILGKKALLTFGEESGSALIWMVVVLAQRSILAVLGLDRFVPTGILFALPFTIKIIGQIFPVMRRSHPILPVRVAESILGRLSPASLMAIIPAHLLGCIAGLIMFQGLVPMAPARVFLPPGLDSEVTWSPLAIMLEIALIFIYVCAELILPELLDVNRVNIQLSSVPLLPFLALPTGFGGGIFHPAAMYALWYVGRYCSAVEVQIHVAHMLSPLVAAVLAGTFCNWLCPDDPSAWVRRH